MSKKFEYVDDNPGSYFGMLVESVEDKEAKKNFRNWIEKKVGKQMSNMKPTKIGYKHGRPYYSVDFVDGTSDDYFIDFDKEEIEKCESLKESKSGSKETAKEIAKQFGVNPKIVSTKLGYYRIPVDMLLGDFIEKAKDNGFINAGNKNIFYKDINGATVFVEFDEKNSAIYIDFEYEKDESLKEDKFVPKDKMSKKAQKELNDKKRGTWGNTNPVTRVQSNKKAYDRKRDKKELDEALEESKLNESSGNIKLDDMTRERLKEGATALQYELDDLFDVINDTDSTFDDLDSIIYELKNINEYLKVVKDKRW